MINWLTVLIIPLAVALGSDFNRRKQEAAGHIYSFIPRWPHLALTMLMGVSVCLFFEAARVCLNDPSRFNLWFLIVSGTVSQILLLAISAGELAHAKKRLEAGCANPASS
ncbi:MAG: hypothetical protein KDJ47_14615 [Hyphomicrobiaceae bacterium]|nr:hypothetical protein [Hyphomicrobiaceae bacterium]